jgi:phosphoribosyl 1,2-cyclic phosphodiesterase
MAVEFTVLASGSRGNASIVRSCGSGVLIDLGLGPRALVGRMEGVGASWGEITSALLTHTHGDHVRDSTLRALATRKIPLYCHDGHLDHLGRYEGFKALDRAGFVRTFDDRPFLTPDGLRVEPVTLSHDGGPTFGFRIEARASRRGRPVTIGYVADTGCWRRSTAESLMGVDVLAVEFNHDVAMQRDSGRAPYLIARNLGPRGHLSNDQGAELVATVLGESAPGSVRHVVLLHLSEQCNCPDLARQVANRAVRSTGRASRVHVASQWLPFPHLPITPSRRRRCSSGFLWERARRDEATAPFRLAIDYAMDASSRGS